MGRCIYGSPEEEQLPTDLSALRSRLWTLVQAQPEAVGAAAQRLFGRPPEPEEWADLFDFVAVEWLDAEGRTVAERLAGAAGLEELAKWPLEAHLSLWVVDGQEQGLVLLRDLVDDHEIAVRCPESARAELPRRTVLRARVVPWAGGTEFFGDPGVYGEQGVIARLQLLEAWRTSPEPGLLAALAGQRRAFARQRDQRRVFLAHFGTDFVAFPDVGAMQAALDAFVEVLLFVDRGPSGSGPTRAEAWRAKHGSEPARVQLRLGDTLATGCPAFCFDDVEGFLLLPSFGELSAHLRGEADFPEVLRLWMETPELPLSGLVRAGPSRRVAEVLSVPDAPLSLLLPWKTHGPHAPIPSPLPEFDDMS